MTRRGLRAIAACAVAAGLSFAAAAFPRGAARAEPDSEPPTLPLANCVRAGRPVLVRAPGALRVRGGGSPWALPVGESADEFLLQIPRADVSLRELEVDRGGAEPERFPVRPRVLPAEGPVRAGFAPGPGVDVVLPAEGLPAFPEAWLLFDDVDPPPAAVPDAVRSAVEGRAWDGGLSPLLWPPDPDAFRAMAAVADRRPRLPSDVGTALVLTGLAAAGVVLLTGSRRPVVRTLWGASAPAAFLLWCAASDGLPGPARAHMVRLHGGASDVVLLRLEALRPTHVEFRTDGRYVPAVLRYDAEDASAAGAEAGYDVRADLRAGGVLLAAWLTPEVSESGSPGPRVPPVLERWAESRGLRAARDRAGDRETLSWAFGFRL